MTTTTAGRGQGGVSRGIYEFTTGHLAQPAPGAHSGVSLCFNRSVAIARDPARPLGNWSAAANRCGSLARRALPCIRSQIRPRLACRGTVPTGGGSWDLGVGRKAGHQGLAGLGEPSSPGSQAGGALGQWSAVEMGDGPTLPRTTPRVPDLGLNLGNRHCVGWSGRAQAGVETPFQLTSSSPNNINANLGIRHSTHNCAYP